MERGLAVRDLGSIQARVQSLQWSLLACLGYFAASFTPYHHWDEFYYLFSALNHTSTELLQLESGLSQGLFPPGFFSAKIGLIIFLHYLTKILGAGYQSLLVIQFVFAGIMVAFVWVSYRFLKEITEPEQARWIAFVVLFLPVSVYLGFKSLSEGISLLFVTFGCWQFVVGLRVESRVNAALRMLLVSIAISLSLAFRYNSLLMFLGLVLALPFLWDMGERRRDQIKKVVACLSLVVACMAVIVIVVVRLADFPIGSLAGPLQTIVSRKQGWGIRLYSLAMFFQFFFPAMFAALLPQWNRLTRFAWVWSAACIFPVFLLIHYSEPRYYAVALIPVGILVFQGLSRIVSRLTPEHVHVVTAALIFIIVLTNRIVLAPLMPYEINQGQLMRTIREIKEINPESVILIPWISDFAFLRFVYPKDNIQLTMSESRLGIPGFFNSDSFLRWVGHDHYIGRLDELKNMEKTCYYVGWTYSPTIQAISHMLDQFHLGLLKSQLDTGDQINHLARSWIWKDTTLSKQRVWVSGLYLVYQIDGVGCKY